MTRVENVLQRVKLDMTLVYLGVVDTKMNEDRMNFDKLMTEIKSIQRSSPSNNNKIK